MQLNDAAYRRSESASNSRVGGNPLWLPILKGQAQRPAPTTITQYLPALES